MRRKTLLTLALSALLVVPAVIAMASSDLEAVGSADVAAVQVREQAQDRDCGECVNAGQAAAPAATGDQVQIRDRDQVRIRAPQLDEDGAQIRDRDRDQVRDQTNCDGEALQLREQKGYGPEAATGSGPFGQGPAAGIGPLHEGPEDGTGNQFGQGGR